MKGLTYLLALMGLSMSACYSENKIIWQIGENDNSAAEFALAPNDYGRFIEKDFGWEDKYFLIGTSDPKTDWPYVIPGTGDNWGGTWGTSGWRSSTLNILFGIEKLPSKGNWKLIVDLYDCNSEDLPLFKISVNDKSWKFRIPKIGAHNSIEGEVSDSLEYLIEIPIPVGLISKGGNQISLTTLEGSWLMFDHVRLEGPGSVQLTVNDKVYIRNVDVAKYEVDSDEGESQPLLIDLEHLSGLPELKVILDGEDIFTKSIDA